MEQLVYLICTVRHVHRSLGKLCIMCLLCYGTTQWNWKRTVFHYQNCLQFLLRKLNHNFPIRLVNNYVCNCRTQGGPITCLSLSDNQLFLSGSSLGRVTVSDPLMDQPVATLKSTITAGGKLKLNVRLHLQWHFLKQPPFSTGIQTICFNQGTNLAFIGTTGGYVSCWDLRYVKIVV